tara:strand:- start:362 stop:982 length:621 start_codon:yes stop_codon:yes gene_type:complete
MKKSIVLAAVAGIASGAAAQTASLSIVASQATIDTTMTTVLTLDIYADSSIGTHITGAAFTINGFGSSLVTDMTASGAAWGGLGFEDQGHDGNGSSGMIMGQIVFLPFIPPSVESALGNGSVYIGSFVVNLAVDTYLDYEWTLGGGIGTFALEVIDVNTNPGGSPPGTYTQITDVDFGSLRVSVVPAPSALGLLGLGGLIAGRRRR